MTDGSGGSPFVGGVPDGTVWCKVSTEWGYAVTGIEIAVGYVFAYLVRKAKHIGDRADAEVDRSLDAGMDRLHDLVSEKLQHDPALERAVEEAEAGNTEPTDRTCRRLIDSLEDAAEQDPNFALALKSVVEELQAAEMIAAPGGVSASGGGFAIAGKVDIKADGGSAAALKMHDVTIGTAADPQQPRAAKG